MIENWGKIPFYSKGIKSMGLTIFWIWNNGRISFLLENCQSKPKKGWIFLKNYSLKKTKLRWSYLYFFMRPTFSVSYHLGKKNLKKDILDEIDIEIDDEKEKKRIQNELQNTEEAFIELEKAASEGKKELDSGAKSRLAEFIDNLSDENSRINKTLKLVSKGKEKAQALAKVYNKFAPFFALPSVPDILLGKEGKD